MVSVYLPSDALSQHLLSYLGFSYLRHADNTTFMAESKEELKNLLMKVKEESEKLD